MVVYFYEKKLKTQYLMLRIMHFCIVFLMCMTFPRIHIRDFLRQQSRQEVIIRRVNDSDANLYTDCINAMAIGAYMTH